MVQYQAKMERKKQQVYTITFSFKMVTEKVNTNEIYLNHIYN